MELVLHIKYVDLPLQQDEIKIPSSDAHGLEKNQTIGGKTAFVIYQSLLVLRPL